MTWTRPRGPCWPATTRRRCCGWPRCRWASTTPTTRCPSSATASTTPSAAPTTCNCSAGPPRPRSGPGSTPRRCAASPPRTFAPFTLRQWTSLDQYTEAYSACLRWPSPSRLVPPITRKPPLVPRRLPVLILSGTLDSLTPKLGGATLVARQMGPSARLVTVANLTHVALQDANDACPASVYQRFVLRPGEPAAREHLLCGAGHPGAHGGRLPAASGGRGAGDARARQHRGPPGPAGRRGRARQRRRRD